jgi:hypothetical protein
MAHSNNHRATLFRMSDRLAHHCARQGGMKRQVTSGNNSPLKFGKVLARAKPLI